MRRAAGLGSPHQPPRHEWASRHRSLLMVLAVVAAAGLAASLASLASLASGLTPETVQAGLWVGGGTVLYYVVFRSRFASIGALRRLPAKEFGIALPFACGVATAAASGWPTGIPPMLLLSLVLLVAGNCLLIARAEQDWDQVMDAAAFFSDRNRSDRLPEGILAAACAVGLGELLRKPSVGAAALLVCAAATLALACLRGEVVQRHMQPLADGLHAVAWLVPLLADAARPWIA